jgi:hypothetical protein
MDTYLALQDLIRRVENLEAAQPAALTPDEFAGLQWKEAVAAIERADDATVALYAAAEHALTKPRASVRAALAARGL